VKKWVELTDLAEQDVVEIDLQTIELFGLGQSTRTTEKFDDAFKLLGENPFIGRAREDLSPRRHHYRTWPVLGRFVIVYEVTDEIVSIVRVIDGTRDLKSILDIGD